METNSPLFYFFMYRFSDENYGRKTQAHEEETEGSTQILHCQRLVQGWSILVGWNAAHKIMSISLVKLWHAVPEKAVLDVAAKGALYGNISRSYNARSKPLNVGIEKCCVGRMLLQSENDVVGEYARAHLSILSENVMCPFGLQQIAVLRCRGENATRNILQILDALGFVVNVEHETAFRQLPVVW